MFTRQLEHPTAVFRTRQEQEHVDVHYPVGTDITVNITERVLAPQPVPYSAFDTIGKGVPTRNRPVNNLAMSEWLGVMAWPFKLLKVTPIRHPLGSPKPGMTPFGERVNVEMGKQGNLGTMTTIKAPTWTGPQYGVLGWP